MSDNEFGPVDLTGLEPDKLPRLIDIPGVKGLLRRACRIGLREGLEYDKYDRHAQLYTDVMIDKCMKILMEDGDGGTY